MTIIHPLFLVRMPNDAETCGFSDGLAQVYRSKRFDFTGTEEEFLDAGLAYRYAPIDESTFFVCEADKATVEMMRDADMERSVA
jgi:hypothetical protein